MKYEREYSVEVVENVFKDIDIVWPSKETIEKNKQCRSF